MIDARPNPELSIGPYDEDTPLLDAVRQDRQPRIRVYCPPHTMVVLGRGSKPAQELHLETCQTDQIPLLRRLGGGCAVVLDPGNVIVSVVLPALGLGGNLRAFAELSAWLIAALERIGLAGVQREDHSDLALAGHKIGGACIYRAKDLLFYSTTLLFAPRIELMERYLRHPPREPAYRQGRAHAAFVTSLQLISPFGEVESFRLALESTLGSGPE
jgi:lipoate---protein ligase